MLNNCAVHVVWAVFSVTSNYLQLLFLWSSSSVHSTNQFSLLLLYFQTLLAVICPSNNVFKALTVSIVAFTRLSCIATPLALILTLRRIFFYINIANRSVKMISQKPKYLCTIALTKVWLVTEANYTCKNLLNETNPVTASHTCKHRKFYESWFILMSIAVL